MDPLTIAVAAIPLAFVLGFVVGICWIRPAYRKDRFEP